MGVSLGQASGWKAGALLSLGALPWLLAACEGGQPPPGTGVEQLGGLDHVPGAASDAGTELTGAAGAADSPVVSTDVAPAAPVPTDTAVAAPPPDLEMPTVPAGAADASTAAPVAVPACLLGTATDCAACGDRACTLGNTLLACTSADGCARAACAAGFANCGAASLDCETSFTAGGTCLPSHRGTTGFATDYLYASSTTIGTDGAFFLSGAFRGTLDFDPSDAADLHAAVDLGTFITKFNADGSYAWTRSLPEPSIALGLALAAAPSGGVVAVGDFSGSVDLDPGLGVDQHIAVNGRQVLVLELSADGTFVWARTFEGTGERSFGSAVAVVVDAAEAVYLAGAFSATVDFDPGPGTVLRTAVSTQAGMLVKLTSAGEFSWVQTIEDAGCLSTLEGVAVATDGTVWAAGGGCQTVIAAYTAAGATRGVWRPASESYAFATAVAAGANGSVYVGGLASGLIDLDPGPTVALRWAGDSLPGGFLLKLAPDTSLLWGQALPGLNVTGLASTDDGGVLAVGLGGVAKLGPDGTPGWTFATDYGEVEAVAAQGSRFVLAGAAGSSDSADFDPGPGTQILDGPIRFLSRFEF